MLQADSPARPRDVGAVHYWKGAIRLLQLLIGAVMDTSKKRRETLEMSAFLW